MFLTPARTGRLAASLSSLVGVALLGGLPAGCTSKSEDDTGPAPVDTADHTPLPAPVIALAIRTPHGSLLPTCAIGFDLYEGGEDGTVVNHVGVVSARGGEWAAVTVTEGQLYSILGTDADCTSISDEEPQQSGGFSLEPGQIEVWWWRSTDHGFQLIHEGEELERGKARVTVDDGAPADEVIAYAESVGATATPVKDDPLSYDLVFDEEVAVPSLLAQMSLYPRYTAGDPVWRGSSPGWW